MEVSEVNAQSNISQYQRGAEDLKLTFVVGGRKISTPKTPLLTNAYFSSLLTSGMKETGAQEITIEGVSYETFRRLLLFIVQKKIPFDETELDQWIDLYYAADQFWEEDLQNVAERVFNKRLDEIKDKLLGPLLTYSRGSYNVQHQEPPQKYELVDMERDLLRIWQVAEVFQRQALLGNCKMERDFPHGYFSRTMSMSCLGETHTQKGNTYIYGFSYAALGIAVEEGLDRLLPQLDKPKKNQFDVDEGSYSYAINQFDVDEGFCSYPAIKWCFDFVASSDSSYRGSSVLKIQGRQEAPINTAIRKGYLSVVQWLAKHPKVAPFFTLNHLHLAASCKQYAMAEAILTILTTRPPVTNDNDRQWGVNFGKVMSLNYGSNKPQPEPPKADLLRPVVEKLLSDSYADNDQKAFQSFLKGGKACFKGTPPPIFFTMAFAGNIEWMTLVSSHLQSVTSAKDKDGKTALHHAACGGKPQTITWLLERKASLECKDANGDTPLHSAIEARHLSATLLLLKKGASLVPPPNRSKQWPLDKAASQGDRTFVDKVITDLIKNKQQKLVDQALIWAGFRLGPTLGGAYYDLIAQLIKGGADPNTVNHHKETPLHYVATHGLKQACTFLLAHDANVNAVDKGGETPLHRAAREGHVEVVQQLVTTGAKVEIWDALGQTPYQLAQKRRDQSKRHKEYAQVIDLLESKTCAVQ